MVMAQRHSLMTTARRAVTAPSHTLTTIDAAMRQLAAYPSPGGCTVKTFMQTLATQRWDDHRYYHQSRINQSLHLVSAITFLVAYVMLFVDPAIAGLLGWGVSMVTRQAGHFFFEPKGYDHANGVSHEYKEEVKVGYNLQRKVVLMSAWALSPLLLWVSPSLFGLIEPTPGTAGFVHDVGLLWLALGVAGLLLRTLQLYVTRGVETALAWTVKVLTDPFYDIALYWKAPYHLLRGQLIDPNPNDR
jgi:hypothetical protein